MRISFVVASAALLLVGSGCAVQNVHDSPTQKHTLKIAPHEYAPLGPVSGRECRNQVMQIFVIESPTMQGAVLDARAKRSGTDLILDKHVNAGGETIIPFHAGLRDPRRADRGPGDLVRAGHRRPLHRQESPPAGRLTPRRGSDTLVSWT